MKKITNNVLFGRITMGLNLLVAVFIIVSMISLLKFDKVNTQLQNAAPGYNNMLDSLKRVEQVIGDYEKKIVNSQVQMDTLSVKLEREKEAYARIEKDRNVEAKVKKKAKDEIEFNEKQYKSFEEALKNDSAQLVLAKDTMKMFEVETKPVIDAYSNLEQEVQQPRKTLELLVILTIVLFFCKVLSFAYWSSRNMKNLRAVAPWMNKSTSPCMTFAAWFIPLYNLAKPCSVFYEMWDETKGYLKEKGAIKELNDDSQMEMVGAWWGLHLLAKSVLPFVVGGLFIGLNFWLFPFVFGEFANMGVFFGTKGLFIHFNHTAVAVVMMIIWLAYALYESYLINNYNKMNKMMMDCEK